MAWAHYVADKVNINEGEPSPTAFFHPSDIDRVLKQESEKEIKAVNILKALVFDVDAPPEGKEAFIMFAATELSVLTGATEILDADGSIIAISCPKYVDQFGGTEVDLGYRK